MKSKNQMIKMMILSLVTGIFFMLVLFKYNQVPACLNADEAAFGYNAYSIAKTGADEHGAVFPLRLQSFNDFKLPLYTYLSIPFITAFGMSDLSIRILNVLVGFALILVMYRLAQELFDDDRVALVVYGLSATSTWYMFLFRQMHEGVLATLCIACALFFFVRLLKSQRHIYIGLVVFFASLSTFAYHTGRLFLLFFVGLLALYYLKQIHVKGFPSGIKRNSIVVLAISLFLFLAPFIVDLKYGAARVNNLLFYKNLGFTLKIDQQRNELNIPLIHNKATAAVATITTQYLRQFSTEFLTIQGDTHVRFGFPDVSLLTPVELFLLLVGIYYVLSRKNRYGWLLLLLLVFAPFPSALTWKDPSLPRAFSMILPILLLTGYGFVALFDELKQQKKLQRYAVIVILCLALAHVYFRTQNFVVYYFHYPKQADVVRQWQCGYKDLVKTIGQTQKKYKHIYITKRHGQPYIFLLYYLGYDPHAFQTSARYTKPDEYGFSQVDSFDTYIFELPDKFEKGSLYIGFPDEMQSRGISEASVRKITFGTEEIFWIYEGK